MGDGGMRPRERLIVVTTDTECLHLVSGVRAQLPYVDAEVYDSSSRAMHALQHSPCSVVVSDLSNGDGSIPVSDLMRNAPDTPLIALIDTRERERIIEAASDVLFEVLWKPLGPLDLMKSLREAISLYRLRRHLAHAKRSVQRLEGLLRVAHERMREVQHKQRVEFERARWAAAQSCVLSHQAIGIIQARLRAREEVVAKYTAQLDHATVAAHERLRQRLREV